LRDEPLFRAPGSACACGALSPPLPSGVDRADDLGLHHIAKYRPRDHLAAHGFVTGAASLCARPAAAGISA